MADLDYFGLKEFEDFFSANTRQALNRGGTTYSDNFIKRLRVLVWRSSETNRINQPPLINSNLAGDEANKCYFDAVVEVEKLKKDFEIVSTGKFFMLSGVIGTNQLRISSLESSTLEEFP